MGLKPAVAVYDGNSDLEPRPITSVVIYKKITPSVMSETEITRRKRVLSNCGEHSSNVPRCRR